MQKSEDSLVELVLSFHLIYVLENKTQVARPAWQVSLLSDRCLPGALVFLYMSP